MYDDIPNELTYNKLNADSIDALNYDSDYNESFEIGLKAVNNEKGRIEEIKISRSKGSDGKGESWIHFEFENKSKYESAIEANLDVFKARIRLQYDTLKLREYELIELKKRASREIRRIELRKQGSELHPLIELELDREIARVRLKKLQYKNELKRIEEEIKKHDEARDLADEYISDGWKLHISVDDTNDNNMEIAWKIVLANMLKYEMYAMKVLAKDYKDGSLCYHDNDVDDPQMGKIFVIYLGRGNIIEEFKEKIVDFILSVESDFRVATVTPGCSVQGDLQLMAYSPYFYYRNEEGKFGYYNSNDGNPVKSFNAADSKDVLAIAIAERLIAREYLSEEKIFDHGDTFPLKRDEYYLKATEKRLQEDPEDDAPGDDEGPSDLEEEELEDHRGSSDSDEDINEEDVKKKIAFLEMKRKNYLSTRGVKQELVNKPSQIEKNLAEKECVRRSKELGYVNAEPNLSKPPFKVGYQFFKKPKAPVNAEDAEQKQNNNRDSSALAAGQE